MRYERLCSVAVLVGVLLTGLHALAYRADSLAPSFTLAIAFIVLLLLAVGLLVAPLLPWLPARRLSPRRPALWSAAVLLGAAVVLEGASPVVLITVRSLALVALLEAWHPSVRPASKLSTAQPESPRP